MTRSEFHLQPSRWLMRFVLVLHVLMFAAIWVFPAALAWQLMAMLAVIASTVINIRRCRQQQPVLSVFDDKWRLRDGNGEFDMVLRPPCHFSRWLLVVPLRLANGKYRRLLVPFDSLDAAQFRRLKVRLQLSLC